MKTLFRRLLSLAPSVALTILAFALALPRGAAAQMPDITEPEPAARAPAAEAAPAPEAAPGTLAAETWLLRVYGRFLGPQSPYRALILTILTLIVLHSDWERAKTLLTDCARSVTAEIIAKTGQDPFVRAEFLDWGVLIRLRYQTIPARRQEISTQVVEAVLLAIRAEYPRIRFAMPTTNIRYRPDTGIEAGGPAVAG